MAVGRSWARVGVRWGVVLVVALAALAGCRGKRNSAEPPKPASAGFPVTLTDALGSKVTVARKPQRIVSLAPTVTEILFAIGAGDRVVAAADPADYPSQAAKLPRVGGWFTPSAERALGAAPDLVIGSRGNPPDFLNSLRKSGVTVFTIDPAKLDDITAAVKSIGAITGAEQGADRVVAEMQSRLDAITSKLKDVPETKRPTAFIVISTNPLWTAGSGTFQDDAIRAAGARSIATDRKGFTPFSTELLMAADPNYLLLSTMEGNPDQMKREVLADPAMKRMSAAREGRLVVLDANQIMRPGPRIVDAIEAMARAFYPERFASESKPSSSATSAR